ncbi:MAG TPA: peptide-methionine (S)-S-oxide reductase MsrA [Limnochordia bacterium]|nr:peptide-methionine (S)-S-oxide reductase MsrA [Limnochordia bacterium]
MAQATAVFGGGCFWCVEAIFTELNGVLEVIPGYSGGHVANPTYELVCTDQTGHAEVVQVTYDPEVISYDDLLRIFFSTHDPTTLNRQGGDVGTQYRSIIFYASEEDCQIAERIKAEMAALWEDPIVTEIAPLEKFWPAEDYHREYFRRNPQQTYCSAVIAPKVAKFRQKFADRLKAR